MKYIVKDWAGNIMSWGTFDNEEDAYEHLINQAEIYCKMEGIDSIFDMIDEYIIVRVK